MSETLFLQLLVTAVNSAILLIAIDVTDILNMMTIISIYGLVCIFTQTLFYCYLAETVTSKLLSIGDIFYESDWYRLPVRQQQLVMLPIQRSQEEFRLSGLGLIDCSLWVFASVSCDFLFYYEHIFQSEENNNQFVAILIYFFSAFTLCGETLQWTEKNGKISFLVLFTDIQNGRFILYSNSKFQMIWLRRSN